MTGEITREMNLIELSKYAEESNGQLFRCVLDDGPCVTVSIGFTSFDVCVNTRTVVFCGNSATLAIGGVKDARLIRKEGGVIGYLYIRTDSEESGEYLFTTI